MYKKKSLSLAYVRYVPWESFIVWTIYTLNQPHKIGFFKLQTLIINLKYIMDNFLLLLLPCVINAH